MKHRRSHEWWTDSRIKPSCLVSFAHRLWVKRSTSSYTRPWGSLRHQRILREVNSLLLHQSVWPSSQFRGGIVMGSAGIELIFTRRWLGWPRQPIKWDILYPVMSCSVFKWRAGWSRGFLLLRSKLSIRWWECCMLYMLFISIIDCCFLLPLPFC